MKLDPMSAVADMVIVFPIVMVTSADAITAVGDDTPTLTVAVFEQLFWSVPVTVQFVVAFGPAVTICPVAGVVAGFQLQVVAPLADKLAELP